MKAPCYTGNSRNAKITSEDFMISATQMRPGMVIKYNNDLYTIFSVNHRTPGNLRGFVQAKMRNLRSGTMTENRFSSEDKVEKAIMEEHEMEYLYDDGEYYYFMNIETYEQMHLMKDLLGDATQYLTPNLKVTVEFYEGKPISVELPATVDMTVVETEPGLKGATVSNVTKAAKLETGLVVQVPAFIGEGEYPRQHCGRHLPGTSLSGVDLLVRPLQSIAQLTIFVGKHRPQIQNQPALLNPSDHWRISRAQLPFELHRVRAFDGDQPRRDGLLRSRAAANHALSCDDLRA